jgi:hypothetical protein
MMLLAAGVSTGTFLATVIPSGALIAGAFYYVGTLTEKHVTARIETAETNLSQRLETSETNLIGRLETSERYLTDHIQTLAATTERRFTDGFAGLEDRLKADSAAVERRLTTALGEVRIDLSVRLARLDERVQNLQRGERGSAAPAAAAEQSAAEAREVPPATASSD